MTSQFRGSGQLTVAVALSLQCNTRKQQQHSHGRGPFTGGVLIVILLLQAAARMLSARLPFRLQLSVAVCLSCASLTLLIPAALGIASILLLLLIPAADIWVAVAGPLTHIPMIVFWLLMLLVATWVAYRTTHIKLNWPNPLTAETLGIAVCVGAVVVSRC